MIWDKPSLREKCPYSEFFWSVFLRIRTEYGEIQMRENPDQKNSEYGHFSRSVSMNQNIIAFAILFSAPSEILWYRLYYEIWNMKYDWTAF